MKLSFFAAAAVFVIAIVIRSIHAPNMPYTMTDFLFVSFFSILGFIAGYPRRAH